MPLDLGRLYRLKHVLDALLASLPPPGTKVAPEDGVPTIGKLKRTYVMLKDALDETRVTELWLLVGLKWFEPDEDSEETERDPGSWAARSTTAVMAGYVTGVIAELEAAAQRAENALAYAEAKVRSERPVGFQPPAS